MQASSRRRVGQHQEDATAELARLRREVKELASRAEPLQRQLELPVAVGNVVPIAASVPAPQPPPEPLPPPTHPKIARTPTGTFSAPYLRGDGVLMVKVSVHLPIEIGLRLRRLAGYLETVDNRRNDWMARVLDQALTHEEQRLGLSK